MTVVEIDPYDALLRAARWAELNHNDGAHAPTWTVLYELAGLVAAGSLVLEPMAMREDVGPWTAVILWLGKRGINVITLARALAGFAPCTITTAGAPS